MATLNIKNFPDALYEKLRHRAKAKNVSVAQEVTRILRAAVEERELESILALRGLGKDLWQGVDPASHVERERRSWDR